MAKHTSHGLRAAEEKDYLPLEIDGTGIGCCPRDEKFIAYQKELVRRYASAIKPDALWPDDDMGIRFVFAEPRCTCKDCMREFNLRHGYSFTKETLERAMVDDLDVREKFLEFAYEGRLTPSVTASRISDKQYRILLRNPSHRYYVATLKLPFEIKRATVANKSRNHALNINGNVMSENLTPRGTSVINVEAKE